MSTSSRLTLFAGSSTDVGAHRDNNEDSYAISGNLAVVADGMGGHEAGEVASRLCTRTLSYAHVFTRPGGMTEDEEEAFRKEVEAEDAPADEEGKGLLRRRRKSTSAMNRQIMRTLEKLREIIGEADEKIKEMLEQRAGTTVTGAWLTNIGDTDMWFIFNVGDSRTYRLVRIDEETGEELPNISLSGAPIEGLSLEQITVDHSEVQYLVDTGQITAMEALTHPRRNVITRALGTGNYWEPDFWVIPAKPGDRLMMCSDGLSGELSHNYMARVLATVKHPQDAAEVLTMAALRAGGRDNITVAVVDAVTEEESKRYKEAMKSLSDTESHDLVDALDNESVDGFASEEEEEVISESALRKATQD